MRQTNEQRKATAYLRAIASSYRVELDAEGWPMVPGRLGRIEYHDETDVVVFTNRRRLHARLLAIPSIQPHQTGDEELRAVFPSQALPQVAKTINARRKRAVSAASLRNLNTSAGVATRFRLAPLETSA